MGHLPKQQLLVRIEREGQFTPYPKIGCHLKSLSTIFLKAFFCFNHSLFSIFPRTVNIPTISKCFHCRLYIICVPFGNGVSCLFPILPPVRCFLPFLSSYGFNAVVNTFLRFIIIAYFVNIVTIYAFYGVKATCQVENLFLQLIVLFKEYVPCH